MDFTYESIDVHKRSGLPHWEVRKGLYFVTFRVADSLPPAVIAQIDSERKSIITSLEQQRRITPQRIAWVDSIMRRRIEEHLDNGWGECPFRNESIAAMMAGTLEFFNHELYQLLVWCIMPNHVHVVFELLSFFKLASVMQSWKSFSAKEANRILKRQGTFWQADYFDRTIRNSGELDNTVQYVVENPVKANLKDWRWVRVYDDVIGIY